MTDYGNKPIEDIKAGDLVYSTNPETGESEYKEVARVFRRESEIIIHIFVNGEEIETTPNHPFWVEDEWVSAKDLREGDVLTLADGTTATITKIYGEQLDEPVIVYNFEVRDFHTYYVTCSCILVHNANKYNSPNTDNNSSSETPETNYTPKKLQHEYKHASDFGVEGNWNNQKAIEYQNAIQNHIDSAPEIYKSTYRGDEVYVYLDRQTNLGVYVDMEGNYVGGWMFNEKQINFHLNNGIKIK